MCPGEGGTDGVDNGLHRRPHGRGTAQFEVGSLEFWNAGAVIVTQTPDPADAIDWQRVAETFDLSPREREVLQLLFDGLQRKQMARRLSLSHHTIDTHLKRIYRKMGENRRDRVLVRIAQIGFASD